MKTYKVLAILLTYPEPEWLAALPELKQVLAAENRGNKRAATVLEPLFGAFEGRPLLELQASYVDLFDRNPAHSLHLFEHIHGESRERGAALLDLLNEYRRLGLTPIDHELPDYLPLFLEYLSFLEERAARKMLGETADVLGLLSARLKRLASPYAIIFDVLLKLSPVRPNARLAAPPRPMERLLQDQGVNAEGVEPLLEPVHLMLGKFRR